MHGSVSDTDQQFMQKLHSVITIYGIYSYHFLYDSALKGHSQGDSHNCILATEPIKVLLPCRNNYNLKMNFNILYSREVPDFTHSIFSKTYSAVVITYLTSQPKQAESWQIKGACTHNDKTEAGSDSGAGCNVNK